MPFRPAWWLPNRHVETLWGALFRKPPAVPTTIERWALPDGDFIRIDRLPPAQPHAPHLVIAHGLEGSSHSPYVRGTLAQAHMRGWGASVLIFRGCGGELNTTRRFYHSGETTDLDFVIQRTIDQHPASKIVVAGFSLGGNVVLKWLGEHSRELPSQVVAGAAVSVPFDLARGARHIGQGFARIYERNFLKTLRAKALQKMATFPDLASREAVLGARTIWDFDDVLTAPVHGFRDANDYYSRSSSLGFLGRINRPTLLLSARNDPFLPPDVLLEVEREAERNSNLVLEFTERGGHVGFAEGVSPFNAKYYAEWRVVDFLAPFLRG